MDLSSTSRYRPLINNDTPDSGNISRPLNAFFIFSNMHRHELRERLPHLNNKEISQHLGELWAKMTPEYQAMYFEEAERTRVETERRHHDDVHACCGRGNTRTSIKAVPKEDLEQEIKFGGYVPPFHIFSAKMKRLKKLKREKSQKKSIGSLPDYRSFMDRKSQTCPVRSPQTVEYRRKDITHMSNRDYHIQECDRAVANITNAGDNNVPHHSLQDNFQRDYHGKTSISYQPSPSHYLNPVYYPYSHAEYYHDSQDSIAPQDRHHRYETLSSPVQGRDQVLTESYSGSGETLEGEEETNYVLVPCDVNVATLLGWPVHMLQKVSKSMLDRFKTQSKADPLTVDSPSSMEIQTALVSSSDTTAPPDNAPSPSPAAVPQSIEQPYLQATISASGQYTVLPSQSLSIPEHTFVVHDQTMLDQIQQASQTSPLPEPNSLTYTTTAELHDTDMMENIPQEISTPNLMRQSLNIVTFSNAVFTTANGRKGLDDTRLSSLPATSHVQAAEQADTLYTVVPSSMEGQVVHTDNTMTQSECTVDSVQESQTESTANFIQEANSTADKNRDSESTVGSIVGPGEPTAGESESTVGSIVGPGEPTAGESESTVGSIVGPGEPTARESESTVNSIAGPGEPTAGDSESTVNSIADPGEPTVMPNQAVMVEQTELTSSSVQQEQTTSAAVKQDESNLNTEQRAELTSDKAIQAEFSADN